MPAFRDSASYWESRYAHGLNSGDGSYGELAKFKAEVLNSLVAEHGITSVIEFESGDGNQLELAEYPRYSGFDVSPSAVEACRARFSGDATKDFSLLAAFDDQSADFRSPST